MKMLSKEGIEMMEVKSFFLDGDSLVMKGKMMGSMNTAVYIKPEDMAEAVALMPWKVIARLPFIFFKGLLSNRKKDNAAAAAKK
ncbi:MAG: hypothetical protein JWM78_837 [Verrucomicrobiaceae bacterium]|nr:hypothetical protein [Verrucomicrobiaceae bacterium]